MTEFDRMQEFAKGALIAELEKIKVEVGKIDYLSIEDGSDGYDEYIDRYDVFNIIDKYINELKGETNENSERMDSKT